MRQTGNFHLVSNEVVWETTLSLDMGRLVGDTLQASQLPFAAFVLALWAAGALAFGLYHLRQYQCFARYLAHRARPCPASLRQAVESAAVVPANLPVQLLDDLPSPAIYGVLRPRLLLPENFFSQWDGPARQMMLYHELVHFRRRDNACNLLAMLIRLLFWFNPVVHLAYRFYRQDQELSCDALTLRQCSARQRKHYARTLLASNMNSTQGTHLPVLSPWDNLHDIKERIMRSKRHSLHASVSTTAKGCVAALVLLGGLATAGFGASTAPGGDMEADLIPEQLRQFFPQDFLEQLGSRDARDPIPADSDYLLFIIDTSGSMFNYSWNTVLAQFDTVLDHYPDLRGFQVMSDMGQYLLADTEGEWLAATPDSSGRAREALRDFHPFSNSSPMEGIERALREMVMPGAAVSLFIFSDEFTGASTPGEAADLITRQAQGLRVHARMFPAVLTQDEARYRDTAYRFADIMLDVTEATGGSFELVAPE